MRVLCGGQPREGEAGAGGPAWRLLQGPKEGAGSEGDFRSQNAQLC